MRPPTTTPRSTSGWRISAYYSRVGSPACAACSTVETIVKAPEAWPVFPLNTRSILSLSLWLSFPGHSLQHGWMCTRLRSLARLL